MNGKFSGRCEHGKIPGECEKCNPPLTMKQVEKNILEFLNGIKETKIKEEK